MNDLNEYQQQRYELIREHSKDKINIIEFGYGEEILPYLLQLDKNITILENDERKYNSFFTKNYNCKIIKCNFYEKIKDIIEDNTLITCMTFKKQDEYYSLKFGKELLKLKHLENVTIIIFNRINGQSYTILNNI